jgi:hypothetical protein
VVVEPLKKDSTGCKYQALVKYLIVHTRLNVWKDPVIQILAHASLAWNVAKMKFVTMVNALQRHALQHVRSVKMEQQIKKTAYVLIFVVNTIFVGSPLTI